MLSSAALKEEQLDAIQHMKKNFLAEEKEMFQLQYDVEELEDQKRVIRKHPRKPLLQALINISTLTLIYTNMLTYLHT